VVSPRHAGGTARWARSLNCVHGTHAMTNVEGGESPTATPGGSWQGCLEVMCGGSLLQPFKASTDAIKNIIEEQRNTVAHHIVGSKVAQLHPALSSSREVSPNVTIQDAVEGAIGGKKI
jgi:hypothetical protein